MDSHTLRLQIKEGCIEIYNAILVNRTKMESKDLYDQGKTEVRWDDETRVDELVKEQDVVPHFAHHRVHELPDRLDCEEEMDVNLSDQMIHAVI